MEPPSKRPRFGPAPFEDDPEADELNEQPEEVNARRDPAVQLERSRAFAAFKLKSAFERIFEKYEKDFTGVGDEIDLRTGEIVVDNGHIQSLKNAQLGGSAEGEDSADSGDGASEAGSLNEEERMLRGKAENRLSQLGHNALPMVPLGMGPSHFARGAWSASHSLMGLPPMLPTMGYPGQMPFGGFPMQYGTPMSMAATDPTWRTPELPSTFVGHRMLTGEATPSVRKKVARLSLSAARGQDTGDEDDIFLRPSATKDNGSSETPAIKKKLLLARHAPEQAPSKKKKGIPAQTHKQSILSLLPDNDDEEDELSILSPIRPASGPGSTTVRSTPAAHHVRLGLVAPTGSSSKPSTSSKLKLQRAVARGSVSNGIPAADGADGASFRTPTKKRRGAKGLQLALEAGGRGRGRGPGGGEAAELQAGTPASGRLESDLVQTPGGTMRRCGEDGFRCEREFCFSCL
ncbi:8249ea6b-31b7-48b8-a110-2efef7516bdd [Thermothielavioides terrestris]|uniref:8249ea6b-31b7-48b8-a110-2efef7516bdd n=1 Tax=Thermothielavioides terrestris TaxID=2587410 RepID=A0A446B8F6_9PEZI|nr:8249ea6b-31b7-48b8-a110-2efef7516bdd [Thermothielavioides terrestris]